MFSAALRYYFYNMYSKDTDNISLYKAWSCVALNYRLHKRMYGVVKTSGNEEDKKKTARGGTWPLPEQIFPGVKRRKRTRRSSTLL